MIASLCGANIWSSPELNKGKELYAQYCAECHGQGGEGVEDEFSKPLVGDWPLEKLTDYIGQTMPEDILLILAKREDKYIAGALNFIGGDTLFGRNWGCIEDHRFLHFEVCYYQAIDFAIKHNLKKVEAGAQGSHKVA